MTTLEEAGYVYNVMSTSDIFGQPTPFNFSQLNTALPDVGHSDDALPHTALPALGRPGLSQGSSRMPFMKRTARDVNSETNQMSTLIFVAVLAFAVLYGRS